MTNQTRDYEHSDLNLLLKEQGTSSKEFAKWLGQSEPGICQKLKRPLTKTLANDLTCFLLEMKGVKVTFPGINFGKIAKK